MTLTGSVCITSGRCVSQMRLCNSLGIKKMSLSSDVLSLEYLLFHHLDFGCLLKKTKKNPKRTNKTNYPKPLLFRESPLFFWENNSLELLLSFIKEESLHYFWEQDTTEHCFLWFRIYVGWLIFIQFACPFCA